ncbi:MAG TPA: hypothetical protein VFH44_04020 [Solirubrobacterales bacterium]|nr:hypothetical protein [Solirubrobacterales bacterium]
MKAKGGDLFRDLYRDLRDRRLLPVVIALGVAILAVPFLLGGGSDPAPPESPASAEAPVEESDPLSPVVLADVPGLRDYRKRLSRFHSRDPFKQQMTGAGTAQGGAGNLESDGGDGSTSSSTTSTDSSSTVTSDSSGTPTEEPSSGSSGSPGDHGNKGGNGGKDGKGEERIVRMTIDVRVGPAGGTKVLRGVKALQFLPGDKRPVVQYVEGDADATRAAFVVSPDVSSTAGDGKCDPGRNDCQFLLMEEGDVQTFVYGAKAKTYRLELLAIHRTTVPARSDGS